MQFRSGQTTAFDRFFLWLVLSVIVTGVLTEVFRYTVANPTVGFAVYVVHLGVVLSLFLTLPYSKFAHIFYRTTALVYAEYSGRDGGRRPAVAGDETNAEDEENDHAGTESQ